MPARPRDRARIHHGSAHARDPRACADHLAALTGGAVRAFHPVEGGWVCVLNADDDEDDWSGAMIELYPRTVVLAHDRGHVKFDATRDTERGGGTHFNVSIPRTRAELESTCRARGLAHAWRDWASLLDVWLEDDLLIECVPSRE